MEDTLTKHQFNDHDKRLAEHELRLDGIDKRFDSHVTYKQFSWTVGILVTIVGGMFLLIWQSLQELSKVSSDTQSRVSFIQGTLQNADIKK